MVIKPYLLKYEKQRIIIKTDAEFKYYELWSWDGNEIQDKKIQIDDSDSLE